MEKFSELRKKHPKLIYDSYQIVEKRESVVVNFRFHLVPDVIFNPQIILSWPQGSSPNTSDLELLVFHLGLVEAISYWKSACPPTLEVRAGFLTEEQIRWWYDLFIKGLGEFFYLNKIDFTRKDLLRISATGELINTPLDALSAGGQEEDLLLVGGGKDSAVMLELLKALQTTKRTLLLNPVPTAQSGLRSTGYGTPFAVQRTIDSSLLELNRQGYLNGHTPFSAYLAFLGLLVAKMFGCARVIVANERSSNEGNLEFQGRTVNHQYSKSLEFETDFRSYNAQYLDKNIDYFSFLRPLYDLQISRLFAELPHHFGTFLSCNKNKDNGTWCGKCAKCASVYLSLAPFVPDQTLLFIFGSNFLTRPEVQEHLRALVGLEREKPFACVLTREEAVLAAYLVQEKYIDRKQKPPSFLAALVKDLKLTKNRTAQLKQRILRGWNKNNHLPAEYAALLRSRVEEN